MLNDIIANALSALNNAEKAGKQELQLHPTSKMLLNLLTILQEHRYVGSADKVTDQKGGIYKLNLIGAINKCGAIKPRFNITLSEFEKYEKRYLPAKGMGVLILSTSKGLLTHEQAKEQHLGGRLIAYCY